MTRRIIGWLVGTAFVVWYCGCAIFDEYAWFVWWW